ncbi:hypothetical protein FKM82_008587 [Ascaphus truei]
MNPSQIELLIDEVEVRDSLCNQRSKSYPDRLLHDMLWKEMGQIMNETPIVVKNKWKNLRDVFRRELKKSQGAAFGGTRAKQH